MSDKEKNLINIGNNKENKSLLEKYRIPLENLSYEFIATCTNSTTLEHIVTILRSGEEGIYPELTNYAEERLRIIKPTSLILWKTSPILTRQMLNKEEQNVINNFMNNWIDEMCCKEKILNDEKANLVTDSSSLVPNIRSDCQNILKECTNTNYDGNKKSKRIGSCDYVAWEKYDVDTEINRIDLQEERQLILAKERQREQNEREKKINEPLDIKLFMKYKFTQEEVKIIVDQERIKGDEFYRIGDYNTALKYYDFCFSANSCSQALNNRALTYYKLQRYEDAIKDYNIMILKNIHNFTSLCKRGLCFLYLKKLEEAAADFERALVIKPDNTVIKCELEKLKNRIKSNKLTNISKEGTLSDSSVNVTDPSDVQNIKHNNVNIVDDDNKDNHIYLQKENKIHEEKMEGNQNEIKLTTTESFETKDNEFTELESMVKITLKEADKLHQTGDYDKALKYYDFCIEANGCSLARNNRAILYFRLNRYEDAIQDDNILISENDKQIPVLRRRSLSFTHLGKLEEAIEDLNRILEIRPNWTVVKRKMEQLKNRIESDKLKKNNEEETLSDSSEKFGDPFHLLNSEHDNVSFLNDNNKENEIQDEKMQEKHKTTKSFQSNERKSESSSQKTNPIIEEMRLKANECFKKSDYNEAIKYYSLCINSCQVALKCRAFSYSKLNRLQDALKDYTVLHTLNSNDPDTIFRRTCCLIKLEKFKEATNYLKTCIERKPDYIKLHPGFKKIINFLHLDKLIINNEEGTLSESSEKVQNIKRENVSLLDDNKENEIQDEETGEIRTKSSSQDINSIVEEMRLKGIELFKRSDYRGALKYLNFCIEISLCPRALNYRAVIYFSLDRFEDAIKDYDTLIFLNDKDTVSMYRRCYCLIKLDKFKELSDYLYQTWLIKSPDYVEGIPIYKKYKKQLELATLKYDNLKKTTTPDTNTTTNEEKKNFHVERSHSLNPTLSKMLDSNCDKKVKNNIICYCERGPGPSNSIKPFPHIKEDYCIENESNEILPSSSETYYEPRNTDINLSSLLNSQESNNNKQNKPKSILSSSTANNSKVDIQKMLATGPNILVSLDNKRINNNNNNNNANENEYNLLPKRICIYDKYDDDQMHQKQNDTFKNNTIISNPYKFIFMWRSLKNCDHDLKRRAKILRSIKLDNLGKIIGNKLDRSMLQLILRCLEKHFCTPEDCKLLVSYLKSISQLNRFLTVKKSLSEIDWKVLFNIFKFLEDKGYEEVSSLCEIYS